jgi:hypothetical protein
MCLVRTHGTTDFHPATVTGTVTAACVPATAPLVLRPAPLVLRPHPAITASSPGFASEPRPGPGPPLAPRQQVKT